MARSALAIGQFAEAARYRILRRCFPSRDTVVSHADAVKHLGLCRSPLLVAMVHFTSQISLVVELVAECSDFDAFMDAFIELS